MKKIVFISAFLLVALSCFAQEEVQMIQFSREYHIPGVPANELYENAKGWYDYKENQSDFSSPRRYSFARFSSVDKTISDQVILKEKISGISSFLVGTNSLISVSLDFHCEFGKYTMTISKIDVYANPIIGVLYGVGNELYSDFYTRKEIKMGQKILFHLSHVFDEMFLDIENWMRETCPVPDSGVERIL